MKAETEIKKCYDIVNYEAPKRYDDETYDPSHLCTYTQNAGSHGKREDLYRVT